MSVIFKTQQGRTLRNDDLTPEDVTRALGGLVELTGYEVGTYWRDIDHTDPYYHHTVYHVSTRHVVEWWDAQSDVAWLRVTKSPPATPGVCTPEIPHG